MPLQNRSDPFGHLAAMPQRGLFTGNRGVIHDPDTRTLTGRRWTTTSWIVCTCDWKGWRRDVMGRNSRTGGAGWTELFFLDEVTALAAGHRPCFYCRRPVAKAFQTAFAEGNRLKLADAKTMDTMLHGERRLSAKTPPPMLDTNAVAQLPDGTMIEVEGAAFAVRAGRALPWSFGGYGAPAALPGIATLVTPPATLAALRAGFRPVWHQSAG